MTTPTSPSTSDPIPRSFSELLDQDDRVARRRRIYVLAMLLPAAAAILLIAFRLTWPYPEISVGNANISLAFVPFTVVFLGLLTITAFVLLYLQTGFRSRTLDVLSSPDEHASVDSQTSVVRGNPSAGSLPTNYNDVTVPAVSSHRILVPADARPTWDDETTSKLSDIHIQTMNILSRLAAAVEKQGYRNNVNLGAGFLITLIGIAALFYFVVTQPPFNPDRPWSMLAFIPKLSLVVLIEIFAYFFLNLYKNGLTELKYFQNEMTSIQSRILALRCAIQNKDSLAAVISQLAQVDRNVAGRLTLGALNEGSSELLATLQDALKLANKMAGKEK